MSDCIFCKIAGGEIPSITLFEDDKVKVIFDAGPATVGHALVIPKSHAANVLDDSVDFVKIAEGMGAKAYRATTVEEFENALKDAIALNIPCVIDCQIDQDEKVFPMVPANTAISEVFSEEDLAEKGYDC